MVPSVVVCILVVYIAVVVKVVVYLDAVKISYAVVELSFDSFVYPELIYGSPSLYLSRLIVGKDHGLLQRLFQSVSLPVLSRFFFYFFAT